MRITVVQMNPGHDKAANIEQARTLIDAALASDRPDMVALTEVWTCLGGDRAAKTSQAEELPAEGSGETGGAAYEFLRATARRAGITLHGGSIIERAGEKLFNTSLVFDRDGREIARYRKIHLFDMAALDPAGYRESKTFGAGDKVVTCKIGDMIVGLAICYDVRFPELFLALRRAGAELIVLPAAFTAHTGKDHWEPLIRARAIETQCWFAAPGNWGRHMEGGKDPRFTYGHSLIADPWGHVVARVSDGTGFASARIDRALTERIRRDMPVLDHRRLV